jgi:hypothetical protein
MRQRNAECAKLVPIVLTLVHQLDGTVTRVDS